MKRERWKPIAGFEGYYEVSNLGRVRGLDRMVRSSHGLRKKRGKVLRGYVVRGGYLAVELCKEGCSERRSIHCLVLTAFVGPRPPKMQGCHFPDRNPTNNRLANLRWDTVSRNHADKVFHGTSNRGEAHPFAKLSKKSVLRILRRRKRGATLSSLATEFRVSLTHIHAIVTKKSWAYL
jgi:hypothetical protein